MRAGVFFFLMAGVSSAQVQSAADFDAGVYTTTLAQGSLAMIGFSLTSQGPSPTSATVSLLPANATTPIPAQVTSVGSYISFVVPASVPPGSAQLIYKPGNQATQWIPVSIVPANLALYRYGPVGPLNAQNYNPDGTVVTNGLATPAQPGQPVVLWGTGLGSTPQSAVQISLGGVAQEVLYAGAAPGQPGLNQINFLIAPGTPDGCYVPLTVTYAAQSLTSFLSKTSDGLPCQHPFQLSVDAMTLLDQGSGISTGEITMTTSIEAASSDRASRQESAQVLSFVLDRSQLANFFIGAAGNPAQSACSILSASGSIGAFLGGGFDPQTLGAITLANATSSLTLPWTSPPPADSPLNALPPPTLAAGPWTWSSSGGSVLAASSFNFALPPPIQIAGGAPLTFNRSKSQTVTWTGSGYDSSAMLQLTLTAQYPGSPVLTCSVPAQAGGVTLPSNLLSQFQSGSAGALSILVNEAGPGIPFADFSSSGTPLLMLVVWSSTDARPVDFQ